MSFQTQKGRLSLLGTEEANNAGTTNWADRLLGMLDEGDFIAAISQATLFYLGRGDSEANGLPEDEVSRQSMVQQMLLELIVASLQYSSNQKHQLDSSQFTELANACIQASLAMRNRQLLFDEVFVWFEDHDQLTAFLDALEVYIRSQEIASLPPDVLKSLTDHHINSGTLKGLEEIICCLDISTLDIDYVTTVCKARHLYRTYIYVWTMALGDYVTPTEELLRLLRGPDSASETTEAQYQHNQDKAALFQYLASTLTGQVFPLGREASPQGSRQAKGQIYQFFFSGYKDRIIGISLGANSIHSFPQLRELLLLDTAASLSVFHEAFEDSYLNKPDGYIDDVQQNPLLANGGSSISFTRQFIISVLLEVSSAMQLDPKKSIFVDMFVARSVAKYPQDIILSGTALDEILKKLCRFSDESLADECQLSVEYLLSIYRPPDLQSYIPMLEKARFYRVLKSVYKAEGLWSDVVQTYLNDDEQPNQVFEITRTCLGKYSVASPSQQQQVRQVLEFHARDFANIDATQAALLLADYIPEHLEHVLDSFEHDFDLQYRFLKCLFESSGGMSPAVASNDAIFGRYIQVMCQQDPEHVADYVDSLGDVHPPLSKILPMLEASGIVDAAVILLVRQGQAQDAMTRLVEKLSSLEVAFSSMVGGSAFEAPQSGQLAAIQSLCGTFRKYSRIGVWLCRHRTDLARQTSSTAESSRLSNGASSRLSSEENLWLQLIDSVVSGAKIPLRHSNQSYISDTESANDLNEVDRSLRTSVQEVFTALLQMTTVSRDTRDSESLSFLKILRAFLENAVASSPSLAELRAVLRSMFSAYAYEASLLALANTMLDKDLFVHVDEVTRLRRRGWRPRGQICEICRRRVWGPGASPAIWQTWSNKAEQQRQEQHSKRHFTTKRNEGVPGKGKAAAAACDSETLRVESVSHLHLPEAHAALIFACRHVFHPMCLSTTRYVHGESAPADELYCPTCKMAP